MVILNFAIKNYPETLVQHAITYDGYDRLNNHADILYRKEVISK